MRKKGYKYSRVGVHGIRSCMGVCEERGAHNWNYSDRFPIVISFWAVNYPCLEGSQLEAEPFDFILFLFFSFLTRCRVLKCDLP